MIQWLFCISRKKIGRNVIKERAKGVCGSGIGCCIAEAVEGQCTLKAAATSQYNLVCKVVEILDFNFRVNINIRLIYIEFGLQ